MAAAAAAADAAAAAAAAQQQLEQQGGLDGFKACFGGEELKRACATLSGALVGGALPAPLAALAADSDLHVRELAFAARQYEYAVGAGGGADATSTSTSSPSSGDYDALYNHGLVLQELSARLPAAEQQAALLRQACARYEAALALRPASHAALYNLGVALSDLARALRPAAPAEATAALHLASQRYAEALRLHPRSPQALNNWGLVLQELSADVRDWRARDALVRAAMDKFRLALRTRPDFDRGCYNLGTVFYTFAVALQQQQQQQQSKQSGGAAAGGGGDGAGAGSSGAGVLAESAAARQARDLSARALLAGAAQYICLAHALQPSRDVYRKSLAVVRQMLPLPFLRAGFLTAPRARSLGGVTEQYRRAWFVLDHASLRQASPMEASLSMAGAGVLSSSSAAAAAASVATGGRAAGAATGGGGGGGAATAAAAAAAAAAAGGDDEPLVLPLGDVLAVRRCAEPSTPEGGGVWVSTNARPAGVYLTADDDDAADAWVDALLLCQHLVASRCADALEEALCAQQQGPKRSKAAAAAAAAAAALG